MPGGFSLVDDVCNATNIGVGASADTQGYGTILTSSGSSNAKGSWVQLVASTVSDCAFIEICMAYESLGGVTKMSVDIGVGAGGSEVVVLGDLWALPGFNGIMHGRIVLPFQVPAGTRIAARCQASAASKTCAVHCVLYDGSFTQSEGIGGAEAINFTSASTSGTTLTPSATINTMGSYSQLVASTAKDYYGLYGTWAFPGTRQNYLVDIAIGAGGSELVLLPQRQIYIGDTVNGIGTATDLVLLPFTPIKIPAGTRIAARCQSSISSGNTVDIMLYGVF